MEDPAAGIADKKNEKALDRALDDSMDASDPPALTRPEDHGEPAKSSGYDADKEEGGKTAHP